MGRRGISYPVVHARNLFSFLPIPAQQFFATLCDLGAFAVAFKIIVNRGNLLVPDYQDLPKGRKRPGWKREMLQSYEAAASDLESRVSEAQILRTIRQYRAERKKLPEITVAFPKAKTA